MFEIRVSTGIDWDKKEGVVTTLDFEYDYGVTDTYPFDINKVETDGVIYLDSFFKQCVDASMDKLIANRVEFRKQILNVYENFDPLKGIDG